MRLGIVIGIVLGFLLTVGGAYSYDSVSGNAVASSATSATSGDPRPLVNWDIVSRDVNDLHVGLMQIGNRVQDGWRRLTS